MEYSGHVKNLFKSFFLTKHNSISPEKYFREVSEDNSFPCPILKTSPNLSLKNYIFNTTPDVASNVAFDTFTITSVSSLVISPAVTCNVREPICIS